MGTRYIPVGSITVQYIEDLLWVQVRLRINRAVYSSALIVRVARQPLGCANKIKPVLREKNVVRRRRWPGSLHATGVARAGERRRLQSVWRAGGRLQ